MPVSVPKFDVVDAFVAMGGNPDKTGVVLKKRIEEVIREFELTIDIEEFLDKVPGEELNFDDFCHLFDTPFDDTKSMMSLKSVSNPPL